MRVAVVLVIIVSLLIVGALLFSGRNQDQQIEPTNADFVSTIVRKYPNLAEDDRPQIEVVDSKKFEDSWYVVTIKSIHEEQAEFPIMVVFNSYTTGSDSKDHLQLVVGPDNHFTETDLLSKGVPDSVILELLKL